MRAEVLLFAGTTEGRQLAEACRGTGVRLLVSTATEYGEALIEPSENVHVIHGRKDETALAALLDESGAGLVIDATHPYAAAVTRTLQGLCAARDLEYLRVLRQSEGLDTAGCVFVKDAEEAAAYLDSVDGNVLLTVGSKELPAFGNVRGADARLYARVLSVPESVRQAAALGFVGKRLICMQGPFSAELNAAMLRAVNARWLVTKDSGAAGGFSEKLRAAKECGVTPIVIRRPAEESGLSVADCLALLGERFGIALAQKKQVTVLGIGTGGAGDMTRDAELACAEADLILGAARVTAALARFGKPVVNAVLPSDIVQKIRESRDGRVVVAMSGDTGFYSGAKRLLPLLADCELRVLPGVSSVSAFCARLGIAWDDAVLVSAHGRDGNLPAKVHQNPKVLALAGGAGGVEALLRSLCDCGLGDVRVTVGENLSYDNERIRTGTAAELAGESFDSLALLLIENPVAARAVTTHGRPDTDFLRGETPMTKQEVRAVTLSKLRLTRGAVCWDLGAGTGSVSLEMAERCEDGQVYAVERDEAACRLIEENRRRLGIGNVRVVHGTAPDCLDALPAPTHVFVGGSGGQVRAILEAALRRNPAVRVVLNTVTAESFAEAVTALKVLPVRGLEIVQLSVARSRAVGSYHLMTAQNPVSVFSFEGGGGDG